MIELKAIGYKCPKCFVHPPDIDGGYEVNNIHYPKYFNEIEGSTLDGNYYNWDEVNCCPNCKIEFWFRNGAY